MNNNAIDIAKKFCIYVILSFGLVYFLAGAIFNVLRMDSFFYRPTILILFLSIVAMVGIFFLLYKLPIKHRYVMLGTLIAAFVTRLAWVMYTNTLPESDFLVMYNAAIDASNGDFSFKESDYFVKWAYQIGFVLYQAFIMILFNDQIFTLQLFNIIWGTATVWIIYRMANHLFGYSVGLLAGVVYAFYIPAIVMTSVLTNQILATFLFYAGAYLLVKYFDRKKYIWIAIGILFALGNIIRPIGIIVVLAAIFFVFIVYLFDKRKKNRWYGVGKLGRLVVTYYLVMTLTSQLLIATGVADYPLENRDPYWKFLIGLNQATTGGFSHHDFDILSDLSLEERKEKEIEMIQERLSEPKQVALLFVRKFEHMWAASDSSIYWSFHQENKPDIIERIYQVEKMMFFPFFIFGAVAVYGLIRKRWDQAQNLLPLFFVLFIVGYAMIHIIIEIQTRYRYAIIPSIIVIQSYGVYLTYRWIRNVKKKNNDDIQSDIGIGN